MMVTLLVTALAGDLVLLPALLAGPLGRLFMVQPTSEKKTAADVTSVSNEASEQEPSEASTIDGGETPHSKTRRQGSTVRADQEHRWPRH